MTNKRNGFTLVEVITVLVILAILAAIMIPAMTKWIDRAKQKGLVVACRTCVVAAQTLASEAYGLNGSSTPPSGTEVVALAGVDGMASDIRLDSAGATVDMLTYSENAESVTYLRLPFPQYIFGASIVQELAAASSYAQNYQPSKVNEEEELLTIRYADQNPHVLTPQQTALIFGSLVPAIADQYIYPMAIYDTSGKLLNIQYVTPQDPSTTTSQNRYPVSAFIIDGETYISTQRSDGKVATHVNAKSGYDSENKPYSFQNIMNNHPSESTQAFIDLITSDQYFAIAQ